MLPVNRNPSPAELRKFGNAMILGFGIIGALLWYFGVPRSGWSPISWGWNGSGRHVAALVCWLLGVALFACSFSPAIAKPVYIGWMSFAMRMGTVVTFVLLSVLYFVFLPFFAFIRLKDPLRTKLHSDGSYWEDASPHEATLERTMRPF